MKQLKLAGACLAFVFCLAQNLPLHAQDEWHDDPGGRQCQTAGQQSAGRWSDDHSPAHSLRYAKDKHRLDRITLPGGTPAEPGTNYWMPIGPFGSADQSSGPVSGRVTDFAFVPATQRVYAATANGGLWFSDDNGYTWRHFKNYFANTVNVNQELANTDLMACGAVAASPDGSQLFVGTGEGSRYAEACQLPFEGYSYEGSGVVVSLDQGKTWTREPSTPDLTGHAFFSLAMDPADPNRIVGATTNGVYLRIRDSKSPTGYSWQRQKMGPETNSVSSVVVTRKNNQTTFFAARWNDRVYQSADGVNWTPLGDKFPVTSPMSGASAGRIALAVQPDNPDVVYALVAGQEAGKGGLFGICRWNRSSDWTVLKCRNGENKSGPPDYTFYDFLNGDSNPDMGRGWWQMAFAVDPADVNHIFTAGVEFFQYNIKNDLASESRVCGYSSMVHADIHVLKYQPSTNGTLDPNRLWVGDDGGVHCSVNAKDPAPLFFSKSAGLPTFLLENFGQHPTNDAVIYTGTQDNFGQKYTGSPVWQTKLGGDRGTFIVDWGAPDSNLMSTYVGNTINISRDGGKSWPKKTIGDGDGIDNAYYKSPPNTLTYAPLVSTPYLPNQPELSKRVAFGGNKVYLSNNWGAQNWKVIADMTVLRTGDTIRRSAGDRIKALHFASFGMMYAGTMDGHIYRLTEQNSLWNAERIDSIAQNNTSGLSSLWELPVTSIVTDLADKTGKSVYITLGGMTDYRRVWHFDGPNQSWEPRSGPNPVLWNQTANRLFPEVQTPFPVSMATLNGKLFMAFVADEVNHMYMAASEDGTTWPEQPVRIIGQEPNYWWQTIAPVKIASFTCNDTARLAMAIVGRDSNLYVTTSTDGFHWQERIRVLLQKKQPFFVDFPVGLAFFKEKLYLTYVANDGNNTVYVTTTTDGYNWSEPAPLQPNLVSKYAADLSVYKDRMFLTFTGWPSGVFTTHTDDGMRWETPFGNVFQEDSAACLVACNGLFYAFANPGKISSRVSADGINWWEKGNEMPYHSPYSVSAQAFNGEMFVAFTGADNGIYLGANLQDTVQPSLPNVQHNTLVIDPQNPATLYAGSDVGIYYSTDAGKSWMPFSNGLPGVPVNYLKIFEFWTPSRVYQNDYKSGQRFLRAATYGRSMFERSLSSGFDNSGVRMYMRKNKSDRGFFRVADGSDIKHSPDVKICFSNSAGVYPFNLAANFYDFAAIPDSMAFVRTDTAVIKSVVAPPYLVFKDGIINRIYEPAQSQEAFRLYVQVQNHGIKWAGKTNLYVLACPPGLWPSLPANISLANWPENDSIGGWKMLKKRSAAISPDWEQGIPCVFGMDLKTSDIPATSDMLVLIVDSDEEPFVAPAPVDYFWTHPQVAAKKIRN